ncbi:hypothetical protein B0H13DRAFT_2323367 [Mycena leptocephala]|nr:hypothetical protein B0H13DRAFT_2323367 [Mycena leptocephala]
MSPSRNSSLSWIVFPGWSIYVQLLFLRLGGTDGAAMLNYITLPNLRSLDLPDYIDWGT